MNLESLEQPGIRNGDEYNDLGIDIEDESYITKYIGVTSPDYN